MPLSRFTQVRQLLQSRATQQQFSPEIQHILRSYDKTIADKSFPAAKPTQNEVFANHYLNFGNVKAVGFDMDYTLVEYTTELQKLIYKMARDTLVDVNGYPSQLKDCVFDAKFPIRGLSVDITNGVMSKVNHLQHIGSTFAYKGKRRLETSEINKIYGASRHVPMTELTKMRAISDLFAIAEALLVADAIDVFEQQSGDYNPSMVIDDVQGAIQDVHRSGGMHQAVLADPARYVVRNDQTLEMLHHLQISGKKLFLCTNSGFKYADGVIKYATDQQSSSRPDWRELFDIIVCSARKPSFYYSKCPFRQWNIDANTPFTKPVAKLERGAVYVHGSVHMLQQSMGFEGKDVLYVGDNLRADLVDARRGHGWHTACIVQELDQELDVQNSAAFSSLYFLRTIIRKLISELQEQVESEVRRSDTFIDNRHPGQNELELLDTLENELKLINNQLSTRFNPHFGSIFRTDGHQTLFAFALRRYADVYTSRATNLLHYSPVHRFFPRHSSHMAHDP